MSETVEPSSDKREELEHYIAYICARCQGQFIGRGSAEARYCCHCGALLTAKSAPPASAGEEGPKKRVLVVEDSQVLRSAFSKMVASMGHEVTQANDGEQALRLAAEQPPDLIITDLHMPKMSGMELIERLRQREDLSAVPIIVLTSESGATTIAQGLRNKVTDYIVKDISRVKEIRERLKHYL